MRLIPVASSAQPTRAPISRRSLLRGGSVLGLSALTSAGLAAAPAFASARTQPKPGAHLVPNYRPSQPHGWYQEPTVGGHVASKDFTHNGKSYRISLLPFDQAGDSPHPVYEDVPADPAIGFQQNLAEAFGAHYSFRYAGGFRGRNEFDVQSYSVFVRKPTENSPDLMCGADLYVVYRPDRRRGDPGIHDNLQWIQVVKSLGPALDNVWRANPFYPYGGLTSIHGDRVANFYDAPRVGVDAGPDPNVQFMAEAFLVQDTGVKDAAGKGVVNIFGGIKWGWRLHEVQQ
ncbi:hypothetical protein [Streptosporangium sp. NPDC000396]|uniref:hypothetical protein n=1 Tax=Streptosporangium sp. NPDC000396 TaxID=3366185 RepID=UPI00367A6A23